MNNTRIVYAKVKSTKAGGILLCPGYSWKSAHGGNKKMYKMRNGKNGSLNSTLHILKTSVQYSKVHKTLTKTYRVFVEILAF